MKQEETIDYFLKVVWQSVANSYNRIAADYGITQAVGYALINIHEEGTPVSQIASLIGVKSTSLSRMLTNMEELGLIYRQGNKADKRSVKIFLTEYGKEKRKVAKTVVRKFNEYLNENIHEEERLQLIKSLTKVNQLVQNYQLADK
jgi:DNA-binding MarR family transcriptional regulator